MDPAEIASYLRGKQAFCLFSGGKDSLAALLYVKEVVDGMDPKPPLSVVHVDTTIALPGVLEYVKAICKRLKLPLIILKPEIEFKEFAVNVGLPSMWWRWCCRELKVKPIMRFLRSVKEGKIAFDGIRKAERTRSKKARDAHYDKYHKCFVISPIFHWTDEQVEAYLREKAVPINPVYKVLKCSGECVCGAYIHKPTFMRIRANYPEFFERLIEIENQRKSGYTFIFEKGKRLPLNELKKQRLITEFLG